jgi:hypothetical protein
MSLGVAMKPKSPRRICRTSEASSVDHRNAFPLVECHYQAFSLDRFNGGGSGSDDGPSFRNISREYFRYEARRNFLVEGVFFLAITAILIATFISGALIIIRFLQLLEA